MVVSAGAPRAGRLRQVAVFQSDAEKQAKKPCVQRKAETKNHTIPKRDSDLLSNDFTNP